MMHPYCSHENYGSYAIYFPYVLLYANNCVSLQSGWNYIPIISIYVLHALLQSLRLRLDHEVVLRLKSKENDEVAKNNEVK